MDGSEVHYGRVCLRTSGLAAVSVLSTCTDWCVVCGLYRQRQVVGAMAPQPEGSGFSSCPRPSVRVNRACAL